MGHCSPKHTEIEFKKKKKKNQWLIDKSVTSSAVHSPQVVILVVYGLLDRHTNRRITSKQMLPIIMTHACDSSLCDDLGMHCEYMTRESSWAWWSVASRPWSRRQRLKFRTRTASPCRKVVGTANRGRSGAHVMCALQIPDCLSISFSPNYCPV